jgi:hypothetical protein
VRAENMFSDTCGFVGMYTHVSDGDFPLGQINSTNAKQEARLLDELLEGACADVNRRDL